MISTIINEKSEFSTMSFIAAFKEEFEDFRPELEAAAEEGIKNPAITFTDRDNNASKLHIFLNSESGELESWDWIDYAGVFEF